MTRLDPHQLSVLLYQQGMPQSDAERMAEEWLAHFEDLCAEPMVEGEVNASTLLGDVSTLVQGVGALQITRSMLEERMRWFAMLRWSGAGIGGLLTTFCLFAMMNSAISI